jgi:4-carboxymuconolactone decarboxylase
LEIEMRRTALIIALVGLVGAMGAAMAQNPGPTAPPPDPNTVKLVGDRFKPLTYRDMTPAQKKMFESLLSGERRGAGGPFNVLLRSPEMGDLAQKFGASMRFHSSIPPRLNELAIIITARHWTSHYEWYAHKRAALQNGLSAATVDAIAAGRRPTTMQPDEEVVYNFCTELLNNKQVSDQTFQAAKDKFGERGIVDLIGVSGYYGLVSMLLNVDRYPLPDGVQPELKALR